MPDHSRRPRTGFVKQFSSVFGMAVGSKGIYDDVLKTRAQTSHFTAPVVARDYAEIFSSSSSIPFLELDQLDKRDYDSMFDYADVFCAADGASRRRTNDSLHFTALKESQQHVTVRKHDMSNRKITPERNGDDTDEITGHAKQIDIIVPLKSDISSAATDYLKQCIDWAPVNKYSRNISSGGLETDGFIEIDLRSYGEGESISYGMGIETDIIISEEPTFEVIAPSDFIPNLSSPTSSFKEQAGLRANAKEDPYDISLSPSRDKSFLRESATDDSVSTQNLFMDDHGGTYATSKMLVGNFNASSSSSAIEKAEDPYCSLQQNVKIQTVDGTIMSITSHLQVTASVVVPQDTSESTQSIDFEPNLDKLNAASEADIVSGNTYCECNDGAFNGHPASDVDLQNQVLDEVTSIDASVDTTKVNNLESQNSKIISPPADQCNLGYVGLALKKSTTLNSDGSKKRTYSGTKHDHLPSSSEDEIDKNSEVAIYLSAVKRAIREAQVWIDIAKESDGVKGFMKPVAAKTFGQVKEVKEVLKLKVNKTTKFFEPGQTTIGNKCSMSAAGKYYNDPWPTSSDLKLTPTNTAGEEIAFKGTAFHMSDEQHQNQNEDVAVDNSLEENMEIASTIPYTPCINNSKEKLTVYNNEEDLNSVNEKHDAVLQAMDEFGSVKFQDERNWCQSPKVGKTDILMIPPDNYEALSNDYDDTNTVPVINESEIESCETLMVKDHGFIMFSFHNDIVQCQVEVKDLISRTGHVTIHPKKNEAINTDSECVGTPCSGNSEDDLISLEENANEMELDPHDQASDYEDFQDFASAEENLVSTDTDGINENDLHMSAHVQITEIEDVIMQNIVAPEVTSFTEDVLAACFSNINEEPTVEEILESDAMPFLNNATHETNVTSEEMAELILVNSTEDPVVAAADESENKQLQKLVTHDVASDDLIEPFFKNSNKDTVDKETDVSVDVSMLNMVTPETKNTAEDSIPPCFNCVEEYPSAEDADRAEAVPKKIMVIPEENKLSQNNTALSFDNSNADLTAAETETDTARQFAVSSPDQELEKVVGDGTSYILEDTKLEIEETAGVLDEEYAYSCSDGLEVEQISTRIVTKESIENKMDESRSMPRICDNEIQERDAACVCDLEDREELHDAAIIEALNIEKGHKATNVESFLSDQVSTDAAALEDAIKLKSTPLYPEHDDNNAVEAVIDNCKPQSDNIMTEETVEFELHGENWISKLGDIDLESRIQISATLPDAIKNDETLDFEQQGENLIQLGERHERKKWEITKESYDLPESKVRIFEIQDTMDQEGFELKRQTDKHERKKWEIPRENFELPVLDDAGVVEENDEIAGHDKKNDTTFAEKPERKKWKIQNDGYEVPVLCDDAVEHTLGKDGSDVITASEEELRMADNLPTSQMYNFESSQHYALQNDCFAKEVGCPDREVLSGFCVGNSKEHMKTESLPEIKTFDEEEHEKHFCENPIHQKANAGEGKPGEQGVCAKVLEDINVKNEIKRTLGMFWKKIYKSKLDEDFESVEINTREEEIFGRVVDKDLNLEGPVELVESPRQQDDIEVYDFSGQSSGTKENTKENLYLKQVEVNRSETCTSEELFSTTGLAVEVQENASSASEQCTTREDEKNSWDEGTNIQNCWNNVNDMESGSEDVQSSNGSENPIEMKQIHEVFKSQQGENQKADMSLLDASGRPHSEMVNTALLPDGSGSLISDPEKSRNVKLEVQEYGSEQDNMLVNEINTSELTGKEILNEGEPSIAEERATEGLHKEVTLNLEIPQNMVSTKERERTEPERVIQEARDRGFSDAKERADTEREKTPVSKQEQLQKVPSDAELDAEENSLVAKRKAELERAAIEKATVDVRQHALEKAVAQKLQEQASQGSSSKFPNSSNYHHGSSSEDKLNDDCSSESLVRFKAINERDERIAERVAKALEEKNLRDLHVLREQAERNRLGKTLDEEIDLWANCKTGNLRALLSTLQYVLGPDSGWQPIQLTDIVATDAVKKAYRKATLFVHPDKLQQRGATIKQKYICEKVFDLLKEAWNRFDRDEH